VDAAAFRSSASSRACHGRVPRPGRPGCSTGVLRQRTAVSHHPVAATHSDGMSISDPTPGAAAGAFTIRPHALAPASRARRLVTLASDIGQVDGAWAGFRQMAPDHRNDSPGRRRCRPSGRQLRSLGPGGQERRVGRCAPAHGCGGTWLRQAVGTFPFVAPGLPRRIRADSSVLQPRVWGGT